MKDNRDELDEKIKKAASQIERQEFISCPDEETLACYVEGCLEEKERDEIETHFAVCPSCCEEIIAMNRVIHTDEEEIPVSGNLTQKAMDLVQGPTWYIDQIPKTIGNGATPVAETETFCLNESLDRPEPPVKDLAGQTEFPGPRTEKTEIYWKYLVYGIGIAVISVLVILWFFLKS